MTHECALASTHTANMTLAKLSSEMTVKAYLGQMRCLQGLTSDIHGIVGV